MKILLPLFFLMSTFLVAAQQKPVLGTDFFSYTREMDAYYATRDKGKGSGYKQYRRWEHHMACKVGAAGVIKNFDIIDQAAYKDVIKGQPSISTRQTHGYWQDLGPHDYVDPAPNSSAALGRINCLAFHPTDSNTLYAGGAVGGLWKTENHGDTWECITNNFTSIGISDIAVDPVHPDTIYILTGDGDGANCFSVGVLKTTNGGLTWVKTGFSYLTEELRWGFCLRMHPVWHDILYVGMQNAPGSNPTLLVTYNGGETWETRLSDIPIYDIEFKPNDLYTVYAASQNTIYRSSNNGISFNPVVAGVPTESIRIALAVSPDEPDHVYALCGGVNSPGTFNGLLKSMDSGLSYDTMSTTPNILGIEFNGDGDKHQSTYDHCIAADPLDDTRIFVGAINGWKSVDSGVTWTRETWWKRDGGGTDPYVHADWHNVYFKGARIYTANDGGVFYSDDYGNSWSEISSGLGVTQFYSIAVQNGEYIGGAQDNGTNEAMIGNVQTHNILGGDGFGCTWHNSEPSIKFISLQNELVRRESGSNASIYVAEDQFWYTKLKMVNGTDHLFAILSENHIIRGYQNVFPSDWTWLDSGSSDFALGRIKGYSQGVENTSVLYAASEFRLIKSTDIFTLPTPTWISLPHPDDSLYYAELAIDSFNSNRLWVVCGGYDAGKKVYYSSDGGNSWINISGSLPNIPMRCIVASTTGTDALYVGTEIGVFYWNENINDWIYFSNALPAVAVLDLKINDGFIYAGTFGRGIWKAELYTPCPGAINLSISDPYSPYTPGTQVYSAELNIVSDRVYHGSLGTSIYYHAGDYIDLTEGFWAKDGTFFEADLDGCPE